MDIGSIKEEEEEGWLNRLVSNLSLIAMPNPFHKNGFQCNW